jgi:hypothetical protein
MSPETTDYAVYDTMRRIYRNATNTMLAELRQETQRAERASRIAIDIAWTIGGASAAVVAGIAGFLVAGLGHG